MLKSAGTLPAERAGSGRMTAMGSASDRGRQAFAARAWGEVVGSLLGVANLAADDLERLAIAAYLAGDDSHSERAWQQAHDAWLAAGDRERAARCAFWLGLGLILRGQMAQSSGWQARGERLVAGLAEPSVAAALLMVPIGLGQLEVGELAGAAAVGAAIVELGERTGDRDVSAFGILLSGQVALARGEAGTGFRHLDEVMVIVSSGEVSPIVAGIVYCAVIEACMDVFDLSRAAEWTEALDEWCSGQADLVPYRGQCLVHRSQILQAHGAWDDARATVARAEARLSEPAHPALGLALYQSGDLHRLRGDLPLAAQAYRAASEYGAEPVPGLALLRLAEGNIDAARATISRMLVDTSGGRRHTDVLAAAVDIRLAAGDVAGAQESSEALAVAADQLATPVLRAMAGFATGSVRLALGDPHGALAALRQAETAWRALEMPYELARTRVQVARACAALGDTDAAELELDAARSTFERLGAGPDLARLAGIAEPVVVPVPELTERECEVLRLVAGGRTNRDIGAALHISEHTVARHVQNIYVKLGINSRAAATAYAYQHDLVER
jgi:ATP/maltotriose-dependent transcriptional regulator MalT